MMLDMSDVNFEDVEVPPDTTLPAPAMDSDVDESEQNNQETQREQHQSQQHHHHQQQSQGASEVNDFHSISGNHVQEVSTSHSNSHHGHIPEAVAQPMSNPAAVVVTETRDESVDALLATQYAPLPNCQDFGDAAADWAALEAMDRNLAEDAFRWIDTQMADAIVATAAVASSEAAAGAQDLVDPTEPLVNALSTASYDAAESIAQQRLNRLDLTETIQRLESRAAEAREAAGKAQATLDSLIVKLFPEGGDSESGKNASAAAELQQLLSGSSSSSVLPESARDAAVISFADRLGARCHAACRDIEVLGDQESDAAAADESANNAASQSPQATRWRTLWETYCVIVQSAGLDLPRLVAGDPDELEIDVDDDAPTAANVRRLQLLQPLLVIIEAITKRIVFHCPTSGGMSADFLVSVVSGTLRWLWKDERSPMCCFGQTASCPASPVAKFVGLRCAKSAAAVVRSIFNPQRMNDRQLIAAASSLAGLEASVNASLPPVLAKLPRCNVSGSAAVFRNVADIQRFCSVGLSHVWGAGARPLKSKGGRTFFANPDASIQSHGDLKKLSSLWRRSALRSGLGRKEDGADALPLDAGDVHPAAVILVRTASAVLMDIHQRLPKDVISASGAPASTASLVVDGFVTPLIGEVTNAVVDAGGLDASTLVTSHQQPEVLAGSVASWEIVSWARAIASAQYVVTHASGTWIDTPLLTDSEDLNATTPLWTAVQELTAASDALLRRLARRFASLLLPHPSSTDGGDAALDANLDKLWSLVCNALPLSVADMLVAGMKDELQAAALKATGGRSRNDEGGDDGASEGTAPYASDDDDEVGDDGISSADRVRARSSELRRLGLVEVVGALDAVLDGVAAADEATPKKNITPKVQKNKSVDEDNEDGADNGDDDDDGDDDDGAESSFSDLDFAMEFEDAYVEESAGESSSEQEEDEEPEAPAAAATPSRRPNSTVSLAAKKNGTPANSTPRRQQDLSPAKRQLRDRVRRFYAHYNPEKLDGVDALVAGYDAETLMPALIKKYGPEPAAPSSPISSPRRDGGAGSAGCGPEGASSLDSAEKQALRHRVRRFYAKYNPDKLDTEDALVARYDGAVLMASLVEKYGSEPESGEDSEHSSSSSGSSSCEEQDEEETAMEEEEEHHDASPQESKEGNGDDQSAPEHQDPEVDGSDTDARSDTPSDSAGSSASDAGQTDPTVPTAEKEHPCAAAEEEGNNDEDRQTAVADQPAVPEGGAARAAGGGWSDDELNMDDDDDDFQLDDVVDDDLK